MANRSPGPGISVHGKESSAAAVAEAEIEGQIAHGQWRLVTSLDRETDAKGGSSEYLVGAQVSVVVDVGSEPTCVMWSQLDGDFGPALRPLRIGGIKALYDYGLPLSKRVLQKWEWGARIFSGSKKFEDVRAIGIFRSCHLKANHNPVSDFPLFERIAMGIEVTAFNLKPLTVGFLRCGLCNSRCVKAVKKLSLFTLHRCRFQFAGEAFTII